MSSSENKTPEIPRNGCLASSNVRMLNFKTKHYGTC